MTMSEELRKAAERAFETSLTWWDNRVLPSDSAFLVLNGIFGHPDPDEEEESPGDVQAYYLLLCAEALET